MALEAGAAMHRFFAAVRLMDTHHHFPQRRNVVEAMVLQLLGAECHADVYRWINGSDEDFRTRYLNASLAALYTSGFYDNPDDRRRTMSILEDAAINYFDRWQFNKWPVAELPSGQLGIEVPFDVVLTFTFTGGATYVARFIGRIDGIHMDGQQVVLHENKTASRLDDAWRESFYLSSQVSGYWLAGSVIMQQPIGGAYIFGTALPQPKTTLGQTWDYVTREPHMLERWFDWFLHATAYYEAHRGHPEDAPRFYHSCNRYFRPCEFVPYCTADRDEQLTMVDEMTEQRWSPLDEDGAKE